MSLEKSGIIRSNKFVENGIYLTDKNDQTWLLLLDHQIFKSDGTRNLFTSSNAGNCSDPGLYSRLSIIDNYKYSDGNYYFMVDQDGYIFRWKQSNIPTSSSGSVTGYEFIENTQTGNKYILTSSGCGLRKMSGSTYLSFGTSQGSGNWYGALGAYAAWGLSVPGFGTTTTNAYTTDGGAAPKDYIKFYVRVDNFSIGSNRIIANNIIED